MSFFASDKKSSISTTPPDLLKDFPRGIEGRPKSESWLPRQFFENTQTIKEYHKFREYSGDILLGAVDGTVEQVERLDGRTEYLVDGGTIVGSRDDRHLLTVVGSRGGKGRSGIIPNLYYYGGSVFSIDPKGDHARNTAKHRSENLKQKVSVIDPFGTAGFDLSALCKGFNPLSILSYDSPSIVEDAGMIAGALVPKDKTDQHWSDTARAFVEGLILHVVTDPTIPEGSKNLPKVYDLISSIEMPLEELLSEMGKNDSLENRVSAAALTLLEKAENERLSVLSTARRCLKFLDYDAIRSTLSSNEINFRDLKRQKVTIYCCLPVMRMNTCSALLRLAVNMALISMEQEKTPPEYPVLMILDEFPVLGYLPEMETAIGYLAGLGVKIWIFLQDLGQLKAIYKERWETFMGNTGVLQVFANSELTTTEYISKRLGKTTMTVTSQSSVNFEQKLHQGTSGIGFNQQVQELLSPEEVSIYFAREDAYCRQLILQPGRKPWVLQRVTYDHHNAFRSWNSNE